MGHELGDPLTFELNFFEDVVHRSGGPAFDDVGLGDLVDAVEAGGEMVVAEAEDALAGWAVEQAEETDAEAKGMRIDYVGVGEIGDLVDEDFFAGGGEGVEEASLAAFTVGFLLGDPAAFEKAFKKGVDGVVVELLLLCEHGGVLFEAVSVFGALE